VWVLGAEQRGHHHQILKLCIEHRHRLASWSIEMLHLKLPLQQAWEPSIFGWRRTEEPKEPLVGNCSIRLRCNWFLDTAVSRGHDSA